MVAKRDPVHRRALRAAAAVTLTVAPACSGKQTAKNAPEKEPAKPVATKPAAKPAAPAPKTAVAPAAKGAADNSLPFPGYDARTGCRGKGGMNGDCCKKVMAWCEEKYKGVKRDPITDNCWMMVPGCTPWGPPAPPAFTAQRMPRARLMRMELAA